MYNLYPYNLPRGEIIFRYNESATRACDRIIILAYHNADSTPKAAHKINKLFCNLHHTYYLFPLTSSLFVLFHKTKKQTVKSALVTRTRIELVLPP